MAEKPRIPEKLSAALVATIFWQMLAFAIGSAIGPLAGLIALLPGWAFTFAGLQAVEDLSLRILAMIAINTLFYWPIFYLIFWWRPFGQKPVVSIKDAMKN